MHDLDNMELKSVDDVFENDEYVLMKSVFIAQSGETFTKTSIGIKDRDGDIEKIIDIDLSCL